MSFSIEVMSFVIAISRDRLKIMNIIVLLNFFFDSLHNIRPN